MKNPAVCILLLVLVFAGCGPSGPVISEPSRTFEKGKPQDLTFENVSLILEDMERFTKALKPLNLEAARKVNDRYTGVQLQTQLKPLFINVYPDTENKRMVFLIFPKDPATGSSPLLQFDKKLPIVQASTIELQIRTRNPEEPLTCLLDHPDPVTYMQEVRSHLFTSRYILFKRFLQSGTYDFDALTITSYRQRGYPFIVFEMLKAELTDTTSNLTCECK